MIVAAGAVVVVSVFVVVVVAVVSAVVVAVVVRIMVMVSAHALPSTHRGDLWAIFSFFSHILSIM